MATKKKVAAKKAAPKKKVAAKKAPAKKAAEAAEAPAEKAPKVEKITQHGVTRPKDGTATGNVWKIADEISAAEGGPAPRVSVLEAAAEAGINPSTATTQYGRWRRFHGLQGRTPKPAAEAAEVTPTPENTTASEEEIHEAGEEADAAYDAEEEWEEEAE